jgi:3'-phosphoadenosine 5'-phosphosulfate sulfotransferase (PAPS reductase)/FAD synthetase
MQPDLLNGKFNTIFPQEIIYNAVQIFGSKLAVLTRFRPADLVVLHMLSALAPQIPVLALDNGEYDSDQFGDIRALMSRLALNVVRVQALDRTLTSYDAWLVGQTPKAQQASIPVIAYTRASNRLRIAPLATWSAENIQAYVREFKLPSIETFVPKTPLKLHFRA